MKLFMASHKVCRPAPDNGLWLTDGGFPFQVNAISSLFDDSTIIVTTGTAKRPDWLQPVVGPRTVVTALPEPPGTGQLRKIAFPWWLMRHGWKLWIGIRQSDAVHSPIPGDVGVAAVMIALGLRKPLFIRHCGTWGDRSTLANRFLAWLLPRIAGGKVVVMATGGGADLPEPFNPAVQWIFATSMTEEEIARIRPAPPWHPGEPLKLVTVGRLTREKNALACIEALSTIRRHFRGTSLEVVGEGAFRGQLQAAALGCGVEDSVRFAGNVDHETVLDILCQSHLFLFPTRVAEGFPKAALEAMACGLPMVASRVSVLPHLLADGCGELLVGTTAEDLAGAVIRLAGDPGRMAAMGRAARERARGYTLERWRDVIGERLEAAWGRPLKDGARDAGNRSGAAP